MVSEAVLVALIGGCFTLIGVVISNNRTKGIMEEKINELTAKVEKHNNLVEKIYKAEVEINDIKEDIKELRKG